MYADRIMISEGGSIVRIGFFMKTVIMFTYIFSKIHNIEYLGLTFSWATPSERGTTGLHAHVDMAATLSLFFLLFKFLTGESHTIYTMTWEEIQKLRVKDKLNYKYGT